MPKFLSRAELYRILQRELPPDAYPDGAPSGYYSTADMDSIADGAATGYANLERVYDNYWPQTADERILDWEITAFGRFLDASLTLAERRDRVVTKIRSRKGLTIQDMIDTVQGIIGSDKLVDIAEWGCTTGGWMLDYSQLDIETYLNGERLVDATGEGLCDANPADFGKTEEEWQEMRTEAYTYQVNVYGYVLTAKEYNEVDLALTEAEPARSQHFIFDGLNPEDMINGPFDGFINLSLEDGGNILLEQGGDLGLG